MVRALRADRTLALGFLLLSAGALLPLFVTAVLPFPDLPSNVLNGSLLARTALGQSGTEFYRVDWYPLPYWTTNVVLGISSLCFGPFLAAKVLTGLVLLLLPLSLLRLMLALGRDPRLSLWGFLLCWNANVYAGWHAYAAGMALALVIVAKLLEAEDTRAALRVIPWSALLGLTHALAVGYAALVAALVALGQPQPLARLRRHGLGLSGTLLVIVPWWAAQLRASAVGGKAAPLTVDQVPLSDKVSGFLGHSLDLLGSRAAGGAAALTLVVIVGGALALAIRRRDEAASEPHRWTGLLLVAAAALCYGALPLSVYGPVDHFYTYPRFAVHVLVALLVAPPVPSVRPALLLPGVALALAGNLVTGAALHDFDGRVRPFLSIAQAVPAGARLLPLEYIDADPVTKSPPLAHLHSYISARGGYDPHLIDLPMIPVRYRAGLQIPRIPWLGPRDFSLTRYGPHYDYVLVQGLEQDPFPARPAEGGYRVHLVREAGMWRLYHVEPE